MIRHVFQSNAPYFFVWIFSIHKYVQQRQRSAVFRARQHTAKAHTQLVVIIFYRFLTTLLDGQPTSALIQHCSSEFRYKFGFVSSVWFAIYQNGFQRLMCSREATASPAHVKSLCRTFNRPLKSVCTLH